MKPHLNFVLGIIGLVIIITSPTLLAADVITTYPYPVPATSYPPLDNSRSASIATSASNAVVVALNAQALLLKEMLQEYQTRAAALTQNNQGEKAKWEMELVAELQQKTARLQKSIDQISQSGAADLRPN